MSALRFTILRGGRVRTPRSPFLGRPLPARLLARSEDALDFCLAFFGGWLVLHLIDRIVAGLFINGVFA